MCCKFYVCYFEYKRYDQKSFTLPPPICPTDHKMSGKRTAQKELQEIKHMYKVIRKDCRGFNNLSDTIHLIYEYMYFFI